MSAEQGGTLQALVQSLKSQLSGTIMGQITADLIQVVELRASQGDDLSRIDMIFRIPEVQTDGTLRIVQKRAVFDKATSKVREITNM